MVYWPRLYLEFVEELIFRYWKGFDKDRAPQTHPKEEVDKSPPRCIDIGEERTWQLVPEGKKTHSKLNLHWYEFRGKMFQAFSQVLGNPGKSSGFFSLSSQCLDDKAGMSHSTGIKDSVKVTRNNTGTSDHDDEPMVLLLTKTEDGTSSYRKLTTSWPKEDDLPQQEKSSPVKTGFLTAQRSRGLTCFQFETWPLGSSLTLHFQRHRD